MVKKGSEDEYQQWTNFDITYFVVESWLCFYFLFVKAGKGDRL